jgi:hypothetical protein
MEFPPLNTSKPARTGFPLSTTTLSASKHSASIVIPLSTATFFRDCLSDSGMFRKLMFTSRSSTTLNHLALT